MNSFHEMLHVFWDVLSQEISKMWIFTVISIAIAALIKTWQIDLKIRMLLQNKVHTGIVFATVAGMVCPLCSCGILPIIISLASAGVPLPPLMALLVTSPVMGPEALAITYGGLGMKFALIKLVISFFFGILTGYLFLLLQRTAFFSDDVIRLTPLYDDKGQLRSSYEIACENKIRIKTMTVVPRESRFRFFWDRFRDMGIFIGLLTLIAIIFEAILYAVMPHDLLKNIAGYGGLLSILTAGIVGSFFPLNQIAAVPVIKGLMALGMPFSAGVTLMFAGPVISIPSMIVLYKIFKPRVFWVFIGWCFLFSIVAGLIFI